MGGGGGKGILDESNGSNPGGIPNRNPDGFPLGNSFTGKISHLPVLLTNKETGEKKIIFLYGRCSGGATRGTP